MISFNEYVIDVEKRALLRDGESVHLAKKPFDVLVYLIERPGELVTREELLREFWPGGHTYDEAVYSCISAIRKALCDLGNEPRFIETRWREGYRFIANPRPSHTNDKAAWNTTQGDEPASPSLLTATSQQRSTRSVFGLALFLMLGFLIAGALWQKSSGDRTGSASTSPATASVEKQISSVGVLPVQGADSDRWLRQGLAEELLHAVSSIEGMRVVKVLSEAPLDEEQLRRLDVDALLESTLLPESSAGSLYLRLLDSDDSSIVWSYHAEHSLDQLAESRTEIVASLANHLTASLRGFSLSTPATAEAWPPYLRARYQWNLRTPESIRNAIELYQQVIKLDPTYANAYAGLAEAYAVAPLWAGSNSKEAYAQVRNFAQRAIELEPNLARAHAALGFYYAHHDYDWEQAQYYFARALELDPNSVTAHQWKADAYCYRLLIEECAHHIAIAKSLDPLSPFIEVLQGVPLRFGKQFLAAEQHFR
ncbi:MAG: winged helix-turn-helix domain-containing protein, partial [Pseudomonadota bacterium]